MRRHMGGASAPLSMDREEKSACSELWLSLLPLLTVLGSWVPGAYMTLHFGSLSLADCLGTL